MLGQQKKLTLLTYLNFKLILTYLKVFGPPESKFIIRLSVLSLELHEFNILPNKYTKIYKIKYS